jgi:hypothetical protein
VLGSNRKHATRTARQLRLAGATAVALGVALAIPALASAAQSFAVSTPNGGAPDFQAGGSPSYTTTTTLDSNAGSPGNVTITLAPGVLASLAANPSCLQSTQDTPSCQIGEGTASVSGLPVVQLTAYLVPATDPSDAAGIDLISSPGNQTTHIEISLVQTSTGNVQSVLKFNLSGLGPAGQVLSSMSLTVNGMLDTQPFTRMPTNCSPGGSTLSITYSNGQTQTTETSQASPDFTPTGCDSLPFNPTLSASAVKDPDDSGAEVVTTQTQALGEAAGQSTELILPWPALSANLNALSIQNTSTPVGSAVATSPLQPTPLSGLAYLTGEPFTPTLTLRFPPPVALTLVGTVDLSGHSVTFSNLPDVPQTSLVVTLIGGSKAAESASCGPPGGLMRGIFTGQNGKTVTVTQPLTVSGCPTAPSISHAALTGLASGKPALRFGLTRGSNGPNLKSIVVALPSGISLGSKQKLGKGISVSAPHRLSARGRRVTATLKRSVSSVSVAIGPPALVESKQLQRQLRTRSSHSVKVEITVTDANGASSSFVITG